MLTWFEERRGLAIAVMLTGSGTGSIVLPLITQHVMATHGWRTSYLVLGVIALLGFPLTALLVRNRPMVKQAEASVTPAGGVAPVLAQRVFWLIAIPVMLAALSANAAIAHLAALLSGRGITAGSAALALSTLGLSGIVGRLITGHLLDRLFAPAVSCAVLLLSGFGVVCLAYAVSAPAAILGAFLLGFGGGSEADVVPFLIAKYFGRARFSTLYGLTWTAYAVGGATGPVLMGHAFDVAGTYVPLTVVLFALPCVLAALLQLTLPRYPETRAEIAPVDGTLLNATEPAL